MTGAGGTALRYAYNTNGLAHHRLDDALAFLADTGYAGVALTLDVAHLDPFAPDAPVLAERVRRRCDQLGLGVVVETGAGTSSTPARSTSPPSSRPTPRAGPGGWPTCAAPATSPASSAPRP